MITVPSVLLRVEGASSKSGSQARHRQKSFKTLREHITHEHEHIDHHRASMPYIFGDLFKAGNTFRVNLAGLGAGVQPVLSLDPKVGLAPFAEAFHFSNYSEFTSKYLPLLSRKGVDSEDVVRKVLISGTDDLDSKERVSSIRLKEGEEGVQGEVIIPGGGMQLFQFVHTHTVTYCHLLPPTAIPACPLFAYHHRHRHPLPSLPLY